MAPPARPCQTCSAVDANLLDYNIKDGVTIFGVAGVFTSGGGDFVDASVSTSYLADAWKFATPATLDAAAGIASISAPSASV